MKKVIGFVAVLVIVVLLALILATPADGLACCEKEEAVSEAE